jgi:hypothetical protein
VTEPVINAFDRDSQTWRKLKKHLDDRIAALRIQNDGAHDAVKTADIRGAIRFAKELLALGNPPPVIAGDDKRFD